MKYHPDLNKEDTTEIMQEINSQYYVLFTKVKNLFSNANGEIYEKDNPENTDDFKNILNKIITFKNCHIEIIGNWLWVSGNTKYYKEILKNLKFKWINNKKAWAYYQEKYYKKTNKIYTLDELRNSFTTVHIENTDTEKIE